ncbi:Pestheic acid cluster transcriptional regulator [Paramyrothecium foliicola]|nr:Pestheic acid cluster transcriptional regulator [Paramyrothecium foliicola]
MPCDESLPICGGCAALGIDCLYSFEKPQWTKSEAQRREAKAQLRAQVKRSAKRRREHIQGEIIANGTDVNPSPSSDLLETAPNISQSSWAKRTYSTLAESSHVPVTVPATPAVNDIGFISVYFDYVFPILFPFYRPYVTRGGRGWLLSLAIKNTGFMGSIGTISSLVLSLVPADLTTGHGLCVSKTWNELQRQANIALRNLQRDLEHIQRRGVENSLWDSVYLLANMIQQLGFELAITPPGNWRTHLDAATDLFEQILEHHGKSGSTTQISTVLSNLSRPSWAPDVANTEQGAFRFFSSVLLVADIISSTALNQRAKLVAYHGELRSDLQQQPSLNLEEITGCQNWVILVICDITTLSRWKKDQTISGKLSRSELLNRATSIERILHNGLDSLDQFGKRDENIEHVRPLQWLLNQSGLPNGCPYALLEDRLPLTRIWICAARVYLLSIVVDKDTTVSKLQISVEQAIQSFRFVTSPTWLRWLITSNNTLRTRAVGARVLANWASIVVPGLGGCVENHIANTAAPAFEGVPEIEPVADLMRGRTPKVVRIERTARNARGDHRAAISEEVFGAWIRHL